jgi:Sensors of blue-light using FAD
MDTRWTGHNVVKGSQVSWEDVPPIDLTLRLNDVLQYEGCNRDDLWEAFRDWMEFRGIAPPQARPLQLVCPVASQEPEAVAALTQGESSMQVTRLIYTSRHENLENGSLEAILQASHRNNSRDHVTGVLVFENRNFLQLIEGSRDAVSTCFARIMGDKRHRDVQVISCGDVSGRLFQGWSMRMVSVSKIKDEIMATYNLAGKFQPRMMSEFAIEEFCRALTLNNFEGSAA